MPQQGSPGDSNLHIQPQGWSLTVLAGESLLEAAQRQGVRLERSCRNGTCRACLCALREGQVRYRVAWPGLSAEEREQGWTLPCVAEPSGPVVLYAPRAVLESAPRER